MKQKFLKRLISTGLVTGSVITIYPFNPAFAEGINYSYKGQTDGYWQNEGPNWYYYVDGVVQKGWINDKTGWYYADSQGIMQTGVIQIDGAIYAFSDSGIMQTGHTIIDGVVYTMNNDGAIIDQNPPMPKKAFDWYTTGSKVMHPTQIADNETGSTNSDEPLIAYDPIAQRDSFKVKFRDDDGEELKTRVLKDGDTIKLYRPTKKGYEFIEWNTKKNGKGESYDYNELVTVDENLKFYAVWEEIEVSEDPDAVLVDDITIETRDDVDEITEPEGTLQFEATVIPVDAYDRDVTWSVESESGTASIDEDGLLTAESNGVVLVTATANDGSGAYDSMRVTISGQVEDGLDADSSTGDSTSTGGSTSTGDSSGSDSITEIVGEEVIVMSASDASRLANETYGTIRIAADEDCTLTGVKANKIIVNGDSDVTLTNCEVNYLEVLRPGSDSTVTLSGVSTARVTNVLRGITLSGAGFDTINVQTDEVVKLECNAATVNISEPLSKIGLNGNIANVYIGEDADGTVIEGTGSIETLETDADSINLAVGSIGTITGNAENSTATDLINKAK